MDSVSHGISARHQTFSAQVFAAFDALDPVDVARVAVEHDTSGHMVRALLGQLVDHGNWSDGYSYPAQDRIALRLDVDVRTVYRASLALEQLGQVERLRGDVARGIYGPAPDGHLIAYDLIAWRTRMRVPARTYRGPLYERARKRELARGERAEAIRARKDRKALRKLAGQLARQGDDVAAPSGPSPARGGATPRPHAEPGLLGPLVAAAGGAALGPEVQPPPTGPQYTASTTSRTQCLTNPSLPGGSGAGGAGPLHTLREWRKRSSSSHPESRNAGALPRGGPPDPPTR
jgi:hypothetical protein